jgi:hypothetical protein
MRKILFTITILLSSVIFLKTVNADDLESTNYKIVGATTDGGDISQTTDSDYSLLSTVGKITADPRNYSTSYMLRQDGTEAFTANVPTISCFETTTDGSSSCTTGPSELNTYGMVAVCGPGGCYDRARFEISDEGNPSDTLYSVEISTDNFVSDIQYIDGSTYKPEDSSTHDANDYRTKANWEAETTNIQGLTSGTQYYIRFTALHGDFTESDPGLSANATTAGAVISFDIDIAISTGISEESSEPYSLSFTGADELTAGAAATTNTNYIWLDVETNSIGGFALVQKGKYGGLYSTTNDQLIASSTEDLNATNAEGFGLQSGYIDYDDSSAYLGSISATSNYSGSLNNVGEVSSSVFNKIYDGDGPINNGRMGIKVIARAGTDKNPASDYDEEITFIFIPRY